MPTGTIKLWNAERGFGFISPDTHGARNVFVHVRDARRELVPGERVSFRVLYDAERGQSRAVDVEAIQEDEATKRRRVEFELAWLQRKRAPTEGDAP